MDSPYDNADRINANWSFKDLTGLVKQIRAQTYSSQVKHRMTDELRTGGTGTSLGYSMAALAGSKALGTRLEAELTDTILGLEAYGRGWDVVNTMRMNLTYTAQPALPGVRVIAGGASAQHRRNIGRFAITLGGRLDSAASEARSQTLNPDIYWAYHNPRSTSASDLNPSGNVRLTYLLPGGLVLFGGVGTGVRLPDPEERYYTLKRATSDWVGNPNLQPTRNNEVDLGINLRHRRFSLRPTLFYSRLSNFVALTLQPKLSPVMSVMNSAARFCSRAVSPTPVGNSSRNPRRACPAAISPKCRR